MCLKLFYINQYLGNYHLKAVLIGRFISFTHKLEESNKKSVKHLYKTIKNDVKSITGSNRRHIILLLDKNDDSDPTIKDNLDVKYHPVQDDNIWKVNCVKELIEVLHGDLELDYNRKEIKTMIESLCVN